MTPPYRITAPVIPDEQLQEIEAKLRDDIAWAVFEGPGFDGGGGSHCSNGVWAPARSNTCGVDDSPEYTVFAATEKVPLEWARWLYRWVERVDKVAMSLNFLDNDQTYKLAARLVSWADECRKKKASLNSALNMETTP